MTTVTCRYEGGLRCRAEHEGSGMELLTDAPLDNHGRGEGFSPTDLVGTALASCILTVMGITAERHGIVLEGSSARVEKTMAASGVRRIARLDVWVTLPEGLQEKDRRLLQRAAEGCPVKHTLEEAVPMQLHWA
jgi:putative redox protein